MTDPATDHADVLPAPPPALPDVGRDERAQGIVEAAYALLETGGLEGLTIRAVLARTGLARRAFYERFAGKDDLVLAVFGHAIRTAARRYGEQVAPLADPIEGLRLVITSIALGTLSDEGAHSGLDDAPDDLGRRHGAAMSREHLRLAEARPADLQTAVAPLLDLIVRLIARGMATGAVRAGSPEVLAMLVYNLVSTTIHAELIGRDGTASDRAHRIALAGDIWEFCRRAIAADR